MSSPLVINSIAEDQNRWWLDAHYRTSRTIIHVRPLFARLWERLRSPTDDRATLLLGPRQVGKTTLLHQLADKLLDEGWPPANLTYFDFSDDRLTEPPSPRIVADSAPAGSRPDWPRVFLLDEIQESVNWQRWLKGAVDAARRLDPRVRPKYILTGSAAGRLRDGSVESGQGRWDEIDVEGLTYSEFLTLGAASGEAAEDVAAREPGAFRRYLTLGGFPEHARLGGVADPLARIRQDIIERAILRDLRRDGVDLDKVKRLFVYLATHSGEIWNATARGDDLKANPKSLGDWLTLLDHSRLVRSLERNLPSKAKAATKLRSKSKIYAADHGLITALSALVDPIADDKTRDRVYEAVVFRHIREIVPSSAITFFRADEDLEIDFIVRPTQGTVVGIEVTASLEPDSRKIARFAKAARKAGASRKILIHGGLGNVTHDDIELTSARQFLLNPGRWMEATR